jgi:predicted DNA-binding protein
VYNTSACLKETLYETKFEKQLADISIQLSTLLSKDDTTFIKKIIEDKMNEMKVSFLSAMTKRVEVLEHDVHTQAQTIEKLEQKI